MFRDFGSSSQRQRIPREHSPFGSLNRSPRPRPTFPSSVDWGEDLFHHGPSPNLANKFSDPSNNGHVEIIIPIQIVDSPSPPPQQPRPQAQQLNTSSAHIVQAQTQPAPPAEIDESVKQGTGELQDRKYSARHNTTDNIQLKISDVEKRAKSEPPLNWTSSRQDVPSHSPATEPSAAPSPQPQFKFNSPQMTQLGGNESKTKSQEDGGFRNIPIFVEGRDPADCSGTPTPPPRKSHGHAPQTTQTPQKNRFQPNESEQSTTPPPPSKKVTKDTIQIIQEIVEDVHNLEREVNSLPLTTKTSKNYLYFDEMLTRNLIKLDTIETEGRDDIRLARRDCIKLIQHVISILDGKTRVKPQNEMTLVPVVTCDNVEMKTVVAIEIPPAPSSSLEMNNADRKAVALVTTTVAPIDLALTPTTSITAPFVTTETSMEISPTSEMSDSVLSKTTSTGAPDEEPMAIIEERLLA